MVYENKRSDVAVFIDFENVYVSVRDKLDANPNFESIMDRCDDLGRVVIARAYADWYRYPRVTSALYANGIEPMYVPTYYYDKEMGRTGRAIKNSVDMNLCIDAMKTLFTNQNIEKFVLATGDRDFIPLVNSIRQQGKEVIIIGIGGAASAHLAQSADEFVFYEQLVGKAVASPTNGRQRSRASEQTRTIGEPLQAETAKPGESSPSAEPDVYDTLVDAVHLVRKRGYVSTLGSLKLVMKELMGGDFKESRYRDLNGRPFAKFKDFVMDAERRGKVMIFTSGTVNEVFLPGEDPLKLSQFAADLKEEPATEPFEETSAIGIANGQANRSKKKEVPEEASAPPPPTSTGRRRRRRSRSQRKAAQAEAQAAEAAAHEEAAIQAAQAAARQEAEAQAAAVAAHEEAEDHAAAEVEAQAAETAAPVAAEVDAEAEVQATEAESLEAPQEPVTIVPAEALSDEAIWALLQDSDLRSLFNVSEALTLAGSEHQMEAFFSELPVEAVPEETEEVAWDPHAEEQPTGTAEFVPEHAEHAAEGAEVAFAKTDEVAAIAAMPEAAPPEEYAGEAPAEEHPPAEHVPEHLAHGAAGAEATLAETDEAVAIAAMPEAASLEGYTADPPGGHMPEQEKPTFTGAEEEHPSAEQAPDQRETVPDEQYAGPAPTGSTEEPPPTEPMEHVEHASEGAGENPADETSAVAAMPEAVLPPADVDGVELSVAEPSSAAHSPTGYAPEAGTATIEEAPSSMTGEVSGESSAEPAPATQETDTAATDGDEAAEEPQIYFSDEEWQAFSTMMATFTKPVSFAQIFDSLRELRKQDVLTRTNEQLRTMVKQAINKGILERSGRGKRIYYKLRQNGE